MNKDDRNFKISFKKIILYNLKQINKVRAFKFLIFVKYIGNTNENRPHSYKFNSIECKKSSNRPVKLF